MTKKSDVAVVVLVLVIYLAILTGLVNPATVDGVSMYPIFQNGSLVFYDPGHSNIQLYSVIIYRSLQNTPIIHRVIGIRRVDSIPYYITQGIDKITNPLPDNVVGFESREGAPANTVIGVVISVGGIQISIPYLGYISMLFYGI
ncbi:signal peptidase I [Sulfolobales archaeon HS-7]|nr:signal peptidase I [Sulfolobales archaeon HS-7]